MTPAELKAMKNEAKEEHRKDMAALERVYQMSLRAKNTANHENGSETPGEGEDDDDEPRGPGRGDLIKAVISLLDRLPVQFTVLDVVEGLKPKLADPKRSSLAVILNKLVERGVLTLVTQGAGRRASVYRRKPTT